MQRIVEDRKGQTRTFSKKKDFEKKKDPFLRTNCVFLFELTIKSADPAGFVLTNGSSKNNLG